MHILTKLGLLLAAGLIVTNRYLYELPSLPAKLLYSAAVILFITGLIKTNNIRHGETSK